MTHHPIADLLPFYANGTLDAPERARVDDELAHCATCAAELHAIEALATTLRARAEAQPAPPARVFDAALARVDATPLRRAVERLSAPSWWTAPARYAVAAVLVLGIGGAALAAYEAHESAAERAAGHATLVFRVPNPGLSKDAPHETVDLVVTDPHAAARATTILADAGTVISRHPDILDAVVPATARQRTIERLARLGTITSDTLAFVPLRTLARVDGQIRGPTELTIRLRRGMAPSASTPPVETRER